MAISLFYYSNLYCICSIIKMLNSTVYGRIFLFDFTQFEWTHKLLVIFRIELHKGQWEYSFHFGHTARKVQFQFLQWDLQYWTWIWTNSDSYRKLILHITSRFQITECKIIMYSFVWFMIWAASCGLKSLMSYIFY